jgi:hypothetical protein
MGGTLERGALGPSLVFIFIWSTLVYDAVACWTWNAHGWIFVLGGLDFAGGGTSLNLYPSLSPSFPSHNLGFLPKPLLLVFSDLTPRPRSYFFRRRRASLLHHFGPPPSRKRPSQPQSALLPSPQCLYGRRWNCDALVRMVRIQRWKCSEFKFEICICGVQY